MSDLMPVSVDRAAPSPEHIDIELRLDAFVRRTLEQAFCWERAGFIEPDARAELDFLRGRIHPRTLCEALGGGQSLGALLACAARITVHDLAVACGFDLDADADVTCAAPWFGASNLMLTPDGDGYLLTGECSAMVEASLHEHALVRAGMDTWALVPLRAAGVEIQPQGMNGLACAALGRVSMSRVKLQAQQIGRIAAAELERLRTRHLLGIGRGLCSYARSLFEATLRFVGARGFRDGKLVDLTVVRHRLADLAVYVSVFDAHLHVAEAKAEGRELRALAFAESLSVQLPPFVKQCQQLHGGRGFLSDHEVARAYRDCLDLALLLGSSSQRRSAIAARSGELERSSSSSAWFSSTAHDDFRARARAAVAEHVTRSDTNRDRDPTAMSELHECFAREDLTTLRLGRDEGGAGKDFGYSVILAEELTKSGAAGVAVSLMISAGAVVPLLEREAAPSLRSRLWPLLRAGKAVLAFGITEPSGGSDLLHSLQTRATLDADVWVLNGRKMFITNGPIADYILVLARTSERPGPFHSSFLAVPVAAPGVTVSEPYDTLGLRSSPTGYVEFRDVRIPHDHLIGRPGLGMHYLADSISEERTLIAVGALTLASRLVHAALRRAAARPGATPGYDRLLSWAARLDALHALTAETAQSIARGERGHVPAALAKLAACEAAQEALECAAEVVGHGEPHWDEPEYVRALRDARVFTVFAGTTETLRELVGASIAGRARLVSKVLAS
jgi:acyl-CoA dehydrogenase